ncbi:hypothetical protein [Nonomuraea typhae]|uniref:DUF4102 domain-containing protein n=1 Tax=Nonomuraea typhae TaxID=2603600 RepID=A0ABW7YWP9_9ACTN
MAKIPIGKYEATIYPEGGGYTGAISLGFHPDGRRNRPKRKGKTKTVVKDKLKKLVEDLEAGIKTSENYTVGDAVNDWLAEGLRGRSEATVTKLTALGSPRRLDTQDQVLAAGDRSRLQPQQVRHLRVTCRPQGR